MKCKAWLSCFGAAFFGGYRLKDLVTGGNAWTKLGQVGKVVVTDKRHVKQRVLEVDVQLIKTNHSNSSLENRKKSVRGQAKDGHNEPSLKMGRTETCSSDRRPCGPELVKRVDFQPSGQMTEKMVAASGQRLGGRGGSFYGTQIPTQSGPASAAGKADFRTDSQSDAT